jgi:uncharacterized protein YmfQ (DUF2313 family)
MSESQFHESLSGLLPQGYAWPRNPDSVLMRVVASEAAELSEHTEAVHAMATQWQPHATVARLAEWEEACGLPDQCLGTAQTEEQRRVSLLRTLRGPALPLADSSPAAPAVIEAACAELGYNAVTVRYNTPFRCGMRAGRRLGALDGRLYITAAVVSAPLRCGMRVGRRLVTRIGAGPELACYLARVVPARYSINIIYS